MNIRFDGNGKRMRKEPMWMARGIICQKCGHAVTMGLEDRDFKYCPYCGKYLDLEKEK